MHHFHRIFAQGTKCLALASLLFVVGCNYSGVGNLTITQNGEQLKTNQTSQKLTGTFDRYLSRKDGDVYTITAYQRVNSSQEFGQYYRDYVRDPHFVQTELIIRINDAGDVIGQPRLMLLQGDHVLTDGLLEGEVTAKTDGKLMMISGDSLIWKLGESMPITVSFKLVLYNMLNAPTLIDV